MRRVILADIHANLTALTAVLEDVEKQGGAEEIWCLGDIVGYGPDPHSCIEIIQKHCSACVAGNHDWAAIGKMDTSYFNPEAAEAAHWTGRHLNSEDIRFLESLPLAIEKGDFTLVHGSPRDPIWEYVLSADEAEENLKYFKTKYCAVGHSHLPLLFECDRLCSETYLEAGRKVGLGPKRLIFNPGGVGQPRDNDPRASYVIYDSEDETLILNRVDYDIAAVQQRIQAAGLPEWLGYRLNYGR
jgi:predicted phosphodiesterase